MLSLLLLVDLPVQRFSSCSIQIHQLPQDSCSLFLIVLIMEALLGSLAQLFCSVMNTAVEQYMGNVVGMCHHWSLWHMQGKLFHYQATLQNMYSMFGWHFLLSLQKYTPGKHEYIYFNCISELYRLLINSALIKLWLYCQKMHFSYKDFVVSWSPR